MTLAVIFIFATVPRAQHGWGHSDYSTAHAIFTELERLRAEAHGDARQVMRDLQLQITWKSFNRNPAAVPSGQEMKYSSFDQIFDFLEIEEGFDLWDAAYEIFQQVFREGKVVYNNPVDAALMADPEIDTSSVNLAVWCWLLWVLGIFENPSSDVVFGGFPV